MFINLADIMHETEKEMLHAPREAQELGEQIIPLLTELINELDPQQSSAWSGHRLGFRWPSDKIHVPGPNNFVKPD
jgi:hypothetical protein